MVSKAIPASMEKPEHFSGGADRGAFRMTVRFKVWLNRLKSCYRFATKPSNNTAPHLYQRMSSAWNFAAFKCFGDVLGSSRSICRIGSNLVKKISRCRL